MRWRTIYLETAAWEMEMPSFASSPCTRGAPQRGLALLMFRIKLTYFGSDAWSSGPTPSALPSPISSEPTTVPADDRLRFHDDEDALPVSPDSAQQHPKHAVDIREPWPFHGTAEDGELLPKSDILESQLATSLEGRDESGNQRRNHAGMVLADRRLIKFGARG